MSFAFMPIFTGDYLRDTRHLSPMKHGIYLLALVHCWDQKGPMPLDEQECAGICNCRSADEIEALRYVLDRFFVRMDDGHYNARMQKEIERAEAISRARSRSGKAGYQAKAKQVLSKRQAIAKQVPLTPTLTPTPTSLSPSPVVTPTTTGEKDKKRAARVAPAAPSDVAPQVWNDYLATRKVPVTETALQAIRREASKAQMSLEEALAMACARGWRGFNAKWAQAEHRLVAAATGTSKQANLEARNKAAVEENLRRHGLAVQPDGEIIDGVATERPR